MAFRRVGLVALSGALIGMAVGCGSSSNGSIATTTTATNDPGAAPTTTSSNPTAPPPANNPAPPPAAPPAADAVSITAPAAMGQQLFVTAGEQIEFTLTVTHNVGSGANVDLLTPPAGLTFEPVRGQGSPIVRTVRWTASEAALGNNVLQFVASAGAATETLSVQVFVGAGVAPAERGLLLGDVTGDGTADVIAGAAVADVGGADRGALFTWAGGQALSSATVASVLTGTNASDGDTMTALGVQGIQLGDLNNDGSPDMIAAAPSADLGGTDRGAVYMFSQNGGNSVVQFSDPNGADGDQLGKCGKGQGIVIGDVTGDGISDLIVGAPRANGGAGKILVWAGSDSLSGTPAPLGVLTRPGGGSAGDALGDGLSGQGIVIGDVTGDGVNDIVVVAPLVDSFGTDTGMVLVWAGGPTLPAVPTAALTVPGGASNNRLGDVGTGCGLRLADVTGDGTLDVVVAAAFADVFGVDRGAIYVWGGGSTLVGGPLPTAELSNSAGANGDQLANGVNNSGLIVADVTGDGVLDVLAHSPLADAGGTDRGAIYVWTGGASMTGIRSTPTARLFNSNGADGELLGSGFVGNGVILGDLSGDGVADLIVPSPRAGSNAGTVYVWLGGALSGDIDPDAHLDGGADERLGDGISGQAVALGDVTGDGTLDLVVSSPLSDFATSDAGAAYVVPGGNNLSGSLAAGATLAVPGAVSGDQLGNVGTGRGIRLADVSGDGIKDVILGTAFADQGGTDRGAIYVWRGGNSLVGTPTLFAGLTPTGASDGDELCNAFRGEGLCLADVSGDGILDVVAVAPKADGSGSDRGAVYAWAGGPALAGGPAPLLSAEGSIDRQNMGQGSGQPVQFSDVTGDGIADLIVPSPFAGANEEGGVTVVRGSAAPSSAVDELTAPASNGDRICSLARPISRTITLATSQAATSPTPVLVQLDSSFDYSNTATNGDDLQFTQGNTTLKMWIQSWNPGGDSVIWILVPALDVFDGSGVAPANNTVTMRYSDPRAQKSSNFSDVFTNSFESTGDVNASALPTLTSPSFFRLNAGHTLTLDNGSSVTDIKADYIVIDGAIDGEGKSNHVDGSGTPNGRPAYYGGGGGGAYGGSGGAGGVYYYYAVSPSTSYGPSQPGGNPYGTATGTDIAAGSRGDHYDQNTNVNSTTYGWGGRGGAGLRIEGQTVVLNGTINVNGERGSGQYYTSPNNPRTYWSTTYTRRGAGGGSGGGVLVQSSAVLNVGPSASITANGGVGISGYAYGGGGGGGGGGRIKLFGNIRSVDPAATIEADLGIWKSYYNYNSSTGQGQPVYNYPTAPGNQEGDDGTAGTVHQGAPTGLSAVGVNLGAPN